MACLLSKELEKRSDIRILTMNSFDTIRFDANKNIVKSLSEKRDINFYYLIIIQFRLPLMKLLTSMI